VHCIELDLHATGCDVTRAAASLPKITGVDGVVEGTALPFVGEEVGMTYGSFVPFLAGTASNCGHDLERLHGLGHR